MNKLGLVEKDAWDGWFPPTSDRMQVSANLSIDYVDIEDNETSRDIDVRYISYWGEELVINAYCRLRHANRTFRISRIEGWYVAKADGRFTQKEKAIVCGTVRAFTKDKRLTDQRILKRFAAIAAPSIGAFKLAVGRLSSRSHFFRKVLLRSVELMVSSDVTKFEAERLAIAYVAKRFDLAR